MGKIREILKDPDAVNDPPRPFFEHIVALRQCLVNAATAWALSCVVAGIFSPQVLDWLKSPAAEAPEPEKAAAVASAPAKGTNGEDTGNT